jgi:hypothetical protein
MIEINSYYQSGPVMTFLKEFEQTLFPELIFKIAVPLPKAPHTPFL